MIIAKGRILVVPQSSSSVGKVEQPTGKLGSTPGSEGRRSVNREEPLIAVDGSPEGNESGRRIISPLVSMTEQTIFERVLLSSHEFTGTTGETVPSMGDETSVATATGIV